jgi:hypothetical protein
VQAPPQPIDVYTVFLSQVEASVSIGRISRYLPAAAGRSHALKLYIWNANICEAFYLPLKFAEIVTRNAILQALRARYGSTWYADGRFASQLSKHYKRQIGKAITDETDQHGAAVTDEHVISALSFGFWEHLSTTRFDHLLWRTGVHNCFPYAPVSLTRLELHNRIDTLRQWRNRVAHYKTVFDKKPNKKLRQALDLIGWVCPDTRTFVSHVSRVTHVVSARPSH